MKRYPIEKLLTVVVVCCATLFFVAQAQVEIEAPATLQNHHADLTSVIDSENVADMQHAWTFATGDAPVTHMPLVENGRVYFADWSGMVYAVDAATGDLVWERQVEDSVMTQWPWHGFAGTGALSGGVLYEASVEGMAYAIDAQSGDVLWSTDIAEDEQAGSLAKITVYDGLVFIGLQSVEEPLSAMRPDMPINFRGEVMALDAQTGEFVWRTPTVTEPHNGVAVWSSFALDPVTDVLYFTTGNNYTGEATPLSDALVAVNARTGELLWSRQVTQHDIWTKADPKGPDYDFGAGPQLFEATIDGEERLLVGAGQKSGVFYVWDRTTGEAVWSHTVGYGHIGGGIHGEASIGNGRIFIWGNNAFPYTDPAQHPMDITAVDAATGRAFWTKPRAQPALQISAGFLANDVYFVGSLDGMVRAYHAEDGELLWTSEPQGATGSSLWVEDGMLFWGGSTPENWGGASEPNGVFAYTVGAAGAGMATTPAAAAQELQALLEQETEDVPTNRLADAFGALRESIAGDATLEVTAVAIADVEEALLAEPFDQAALVGALQELALEMRAAADAGDEALTVELASLVDQTAELIQGEGYVPRMEVDVP